MSFISKLGLVVTAQAGQANATLSGLGSRMDMMGRSAAQNARQTGLWNQQWRALGTTIRYAAAGVAVFGTFNAARNLAAFQKQLGLISAIGTSGGGVPLVGRQLGDLKNAIIDMSVDTLQSIPDATSAVINFLSTVQNVPRDEIVPMVQRISQAATLTQTPVEDLTKALTTLDIAFGLPNTPRNINKLSEQWRKLIYLAPGGQAAAPQIVGQLGNLAGGARSANVSVPGLMGLLLGTLRFGMTPQQAGQGLTYLLRTIALPSLQTKDGRRAFAEAFGTSNPAEMQNMVQRLGGIGILQGVFKHARSLGVHGNLKKAGAIAATQDPNALVDPGTIAGLGLTGEGIAFLGRFARRQHSLRTLVALYTRYVAQQSIDTPNLEQDLKNLGASWNSATKSTNDFAKNWGLFIRQSNLSQAASAIQALQYHAASALAPVLNFASRPLVGLARLAKAHPDETTWITRILAGGAAVYGASRLFGFKGPLGKIFGKIGLGTAGRAALLSKTAEDAAKGLAAHNVQDGSPERPFYVIVMGQLISDPGEKTTKSAKDTVTEAEKVLKRSLPGAAAIRALGILGGGAAAFSLGAILSTPGDQELSSKEQRRRAVIKYMSQHKDLFPEVNRFFAGKVQGVSGQTFENLLRGATGKKATGRDLMNVETRLGFLESQYRKQHSFFGNVGKAIQNDLTIDLTIINKDGSKTKTKVHVNPNDVTYQGGTTPGSRGTHKIIKKLNI